MISDVGYSFNFSSPTVELFDTLDLAKFYILYNKIEERDPNAKILQSVDLQSLNFIMEEVRSLNSIITNYRFIFNETCILQYYQIEINFYICGDIVLSFMIVHSETEIKFANRTKFISPNEIKCTISIVNWPFISSKNTLYIWSTMDSPTRVKVYSFFVIKFNNILT